MPLPAAVNFPADKNADTREFVLRESNDRDRTVAFADLLPGKPAIVHDALHDRLKPHVKIVMPIVNQFYGTREFAIADPDGYVLTFAERV